MGGAVLYETAGHEPRRYPAPPSSAVASVHTCREFTRARSETRKTMREIRTECRLVMGGRPQECRSGRSTGPAGVQARKGWRLVRGSR